MAWFKAQARADSPRHAKVIIDQPIGSDWAPDWVTDLTGEQPARDFIAAVNDLGELDEITVEINSPGGDVASGVRIYNYLRDHQAKIHTRVTGNASSIATIIMMAGDVRSMAIGSSMMVHRASGLMVGFFNAKEMADTAKNLSKIDASMVDIYAASTGKGKDEINELLDRGDTFLDADEAIDWGFATEADADLRAVACADPRLYLRQLEQASEIAGLRAQIKGKQNTNAAMTAADALAVAFDITTEEAEAQAADLGDRVMSLIATAKQDFETARAAAEPIAQALGIETAAVIDDPKGAAARLSEMVSAAGDIAISQDRSRITAIIKACQTTGQNQLLEKLVVNGMAEQQASEYIYDVAAASGNQQSIHNSHSPEGGHRTGIDYNAIYARQNQKAQA